MQELDNAFFEAYKRLDRLCSDLYGCQNGVSRYIADMEQIPSRDRLAIPSWEESYKTLKHLRWVRNRIAHDDEPFRICTERDVRDVNDFRHAIISGQDPLTELRKYREASKRREIAVTAKKPANSEPAPRSGGSGAIILVIAAIFAAIAYIVSRL